jgi:UDP-GlcNAc:undecaprenyl-phosphate GlcNAc-1-phosphate transferase
MVAVVALAAALLVTPLAMVAARATGTVDRPGELKPHAAPVPYLGGLGVFAGLAVGVLDVRPSVIVPLTAALVLGVADDRLDLPATVRLVGEVAIGVAVVATCPVHLAGAVAAVVIVPVTVLLINGVNLLDGLDLLAGGVTGVGAVGFALILHEPGRRMAVALAAALVGFLVFNRPPARIYLGDGGSYLLGTALAVLLALSWAPHRNGAVGTAALALVAVPVAEVACAVIRRRRSGRSLLAGDRGHPYDRLVARGWPPLRVSLAYVGVATVVAAAAGAAAHRSTVVAAVVVDVLAGVALMVAAAACGAIAPDHGARR